MEDIQKKSLLLMQKVLQLSEQECRVQEYETSQVWDSLKHMELIVAFEEGFGIEFEEDEMIEMTSLAKIIGILKSRSNA